MALPVGHVPAGEGKSPDGQGVSLFYIERVLLDTLRDDGPGWKFDDSRFIPEVIRDPDAIFEGLNRPGMDEAVAYSVRPTHDPEEEGEGPPRYGVVFVVYASPAPWGYVIFDWEWRDEDGNEPGHPAGWESDFSRRTWNRI